MLKARYIIELANAAAAAEELRAAPDVLENDEESNLSKPSGYDFFCLLIPTFFIWARWATYTNLKPEMESNKKADQCRYWYRTSEAEVKAWVASIMWWALFKNMSFEHVFHHNVGPKRWFSENRWLQIKRFFKVSDPTTDAEHKAGKMWRVREL